MNITDQDQTYVYFITTEGKGNTPIKIGVSANPESRLKELQTGNPFKLKIIKTVPCLTKCAAFSLESCLHGMTRVTNKRMTGEWFKIYQPLDTLIGMSLKRMSANRANVVGNEEYLEIVDRRLKAKRKRRKDKRASKQA